MAVMPKRPCAHPGCTGRTYGRYCDQHQRGADVRQRGSASERLYDWHWRQAAKAFLAEHPLCGMRDGAAKPVMSRCHELGRVTAAVQVDHAEPHRGDVTRFWDRANWQALCRACGARKSQAGL